MIFLVIDLACWNWLYHHNWIWCPGHNERQQNQELYNKVSWGYLIEGLSRPATPKEHFDRYYK